MKHLFLGVLGLVFFISCKQDTKTNEPKVTEAYNQGSTEMYVESTVYPLIDEINQVFKSYYSNANIELKMLAQNKILDAVYNDSARLAVVPKTFSQAELEIFKGKVLPKITPIAKDAVLFITQKGSNDTLINYNDVVAIFKGTKTSNKVFVFHDVNSSIVNSIMNDAQVKTVSKNVYYAKTVEEIVSYINKNTNAIGVVGLNWMVNPSENIKQNSSKLRSMLVFNNTSKKYVLPSQSTIADNTYPLIRTINIIDIQGKTGLGTGFASFAASDKGQRIILKSGLMPIKLPKREINIVE